MPFIQAIEGEDISNAYIVRETYLGTHRQEGSEDIGSPSRTMTLFPGLILSLRVTRSLQKWALSSILPTESEICT